MVQDYSLYERNHQNRQEQAFGICLGKITSVDINSRTCSIVTFMGHGTMNDQVISNCQWLSTDANPEGDESGCIPRRGSLGLVFFVDGETFIWGFLRPLSKGGSAAQGPESPKLNEGDKIISTKAGNRITIKRSGLIELYSSDLLQRLMFPLGGKIVDLCQEYNLKADGGSIEWTSDPDTFSTLWDTEFRQSVARLFVVRERRGYVTEDILLKTEVGPALPGIQGTTTPTYIHTIKSTGEVTTTVSPPQPEGTPIGFKSVMGPDGSLQVLAGTAQTVAFAISATGETKLSVNSIAEASISATGDITIKNKVGEATVSATGDIAVKNKMAKLTMSVKGDVEIKAGACSITMSATGEIKIDTPNKVTMSAKAGFDIKSMGPVNIEGIGPMNIKSKGPISLDGGTGASDFVLTNPTTLSPFTGAPLVPFSTTIKVSK